MKACVLQQPHGTLGTSLRLPWIIIAAVCLRAVALGAFHLLGGGTPETWEYEIIANNLLAGRGFAFPLWGTEYQTSVVPGFPLFCAALHRVWGPGLGLYFVVQLLLSAVFVVAVHRLANRIIDGEGAAVAGLLAAFDPGLIVYQSYKVDVALTASILMLASALAALATEDAASRAGAFLTGVLAGLGTLFRPDSAAVLPFAALLPLRAGARPGGPVRAALVLVGFTSALLPWFARNHNHHGRLLLTTGAGQLLWAGNNPRSTGTLWTTDGTPMFNAVSAGMKADLVGAGELANYDRFRSEARAFIAADPPAAAFRWARTFLYFWTLAPDYSRRAYYKHVPAPLHLAARLVFPLLVLAAVLGTWTAVRAGRPLVIALWIVPLGISVIHATHYVEGRHRLLAVPFLLPAAAQGALALSRVLRRSLQTAD